MANGTIKIDVLLDTKNIVSDKDKIESILGGLGKGTGDVMQTDFDKNASRVTSKVQTVDREADKLKNAGSGAGDKISISVDKNTEHATKRINITKQEFDKLKNVGSGAGDTLSRDVSKNTGKMEKNVGDFSNKVKRLENDFMGVGNSATNATNKVNKGFDTSNLSVKRMILGVATLAATLAGVGTFTNLIGKAIGRVDTIDTAIKSLTVLTGSGEDAKAVMEGLGRAIDGTPIALNQVALGAKKTVAAGMEGKKVEEVFQSIADAAYGVGNGAESIDQITDALASMQSSGTVYSDDINRMVDAGVPAWKILANATGQSVGDMKKAVSDGSLESEEAINMLVKGIEKGTDGMAGSTARMGGLAKTAGNTISGSFGNMQTAAVKSLANIADNLKGPIIDSMEFLKSVFKSFADYTASKEFQEGLDKFVLNIKTFVGFLKDHKETVYAFAKGIGYLVGVLLGLKIIKTIIGWGTNIVGTFTNAGRSVGNFTRRLLGMETNSATSTASVRMLRLEVERLNAALARNQGMSIGAGTGTVRRTAGITAARTATAAPVMDTRVARNAARSGGKLATVGKFAGKAIPAGMILLSASELLGMTKETAGSHVG